MISHFYDSRACLDVIGNKLFDKQIQAQKKEQHIYKEFLT